MLIDRLIDELKRSQGVEGDGSPVLIEERKQKHTTFRFEIQPEFWNGDPALRFMVTTFSGSGSTGRSRKAFAWPTDDRKHTLKHLADTVLAALEPDAEKRDPRSWFGRGFDNLTGARFLNFIPCIAEHSYYGYRTWLAAKIMEDNQQGQLVTLYHEREKKSPMWMRLPVETFRTVRTMFQPGD
ncbi:MAG: hypothetical protein SynsKO_29630 [Synoicihabitans sp.]